MKYKVICEVCGKEQIYDNLEDAYNDGWDYPPYIGEFGILSPRTCPDCDITRTVWYKFQSSDRINIHDLKVIERIKNEPESLYVEED